jgi:hypothetical protein
VISHGKSTADLFTSHRPGVCSIDHRQPCRSCRKPIAVLAAGFKDDADRYDSGAGFRHVHFLQHSVMTVMPDQLDCRYTSIGTMLQLFA